MKLHGWLVVAATLLFIILIVKYWKMPTIDPFDDTRYMKAMEQNVAWRNTLQYIQDNPKESLPYLNAVKTLFFDDKCTFKKQIDFKDLTSKYSMVFS